MGNINIEGTFEYSGRTYGITHSKRGYLNIWVYAPGNSGSHRAWQRVTKFNEGFERSDLEVAREWVEENIYE